MNVCRPDSSERVMTMLFALCPSVGPYLNLQIFALAKTQVPGQSHGLQCHDLQYLPRHHGAPLAPTAGQFRPFLPLSDSLWGRRGAIWGAFAPGGQSLGPLRGNFGRKNDTLFFCLLYPFL